MIDVSVGTRIDRPVERVFAYTADIANDPTWQSDMLEARRMTEGPVGLGTTYRIRVKPSMGVSEGSVEMVELQPGRRQVFRGDMGPMKPTITHLFESADGGTSLTRHVRFELPGPMRLMQPVVRAMVRKRNAGFLAKLKEILEAQPSG